MVIILAVAFVLLLYKVKLVKLRKASNILLFGITIFSLILKLNIVAACISILGIITFFITSNLLAKNKRKSNQSTNGAYKDLTKRDAAEILGVSENASNREIKAAYYKLISKIHPDKGGNNFLANQITNAYKILIK